MSEEHSPAADHVADVVETHIQDANETRARAEETARQIAEGAMEAERGHRIERMEREFETWRQERQEDRQSLSSLREQVAEINGALATLVLAAAPPSSIPSTLEEPPPEDPIAILEPEIVPVVDHEEPLVPELPKKKNRMRFV